MLVRTEAPLSCSVEKVDGRAVIHLRGEIDIATRDELKDALEPHIGPSKTVVLDLSRVEFMGVVALDVLEDAQAQLTLDGGSLTLRSPSASAQRLLTIAATQPLVDAIAQHA